MESEMKRLKSDYGVGPGIRDLIKLPHHTALSVENFEGAMKFFSGIVGMNIEDEIDFRNERDLGVVVGLPGAKVRWALLEMHGYRIELFKYYDPTGLAQPTQQCDIGLTHICFQVGDADETYRRLTEIGHKSISTPRLLRGGRSRTFYLHGPDGIVVEFLESSA